MKGSLPLVNCQYIIDRLYHDAREKARAEAFIRAAGFSTEEVIRAVWEHIARTGEIPDSGEGNERHDAVRDPKERLGGLKVSFGTREDLVNLDDVQMQDMIAGCYA